MVRRRRRLAQRLTTADVAGRRKKKAGQGSSGRLFRRTRNVNPRPKNPRPKPQRPPRTPRMRPKKTVGERLRPEEGSEPRPNIRLRIVGVVTLALFALMLMRLWYLQVLDASAAVQQVVTNEVRSVPLPAPRGLILDRGDHVLVGDTVTEDITLSRATALLEPAVIGRLAVLAGESTNAVSETLQNPTYSQYLPVPVIQGATPYQIAYVREHASLFPGVAVSEESERTYPYGNLAAQVLGYVDVISQQELAANPNAGYSYNSEFGQTGVENQYESVLRGTPGTERLQVNAQGTVVGTLGETSPKAGDDVVLNIDAGLQQTTEYWLAEQIKRDRKTFDTVTNLYPPAPDGAAVVLDPQTGAVLAMASFPTYNPEWWVGGISTAHYDYLNAQAQDQPLLNRAIDGTYPPGSTFKLATATAALQTGLISQYTTVDDPGYFNIPDCTGPGCHLTDNESEAQPAPIDVTQALIVSSDVFFYNMGYDFWTQRGVYGLQPIQNVAADYGYGQPTGIDLPGEQAGQFYARVDSPQERQKLHDEDPTAYPYGADSWTTGSNLQMAFGQGETVITPLEQAVAYATFANGGTRYAPEVAAGVVSPDGTLIEKFAPKKMGHVDLPPNVYQPILTGLMGVVSNSDGTGFLAFQGFPLSTFPLAGKTGTASNPNNEEPTSWFVAFGPEPDPRYVVAVVVDQGGYGADAAAPVVRNIFDYLVAHPVGPVKFGLPTPVTGVQSQRR
jgi:penicillin-binding protein 2